MGYCEGLKGLKKKQKNRLPIFSSGSRNSPLFFNPITWKGPSLLDFVGAASSRDRFNSRLEAAPTGVFFSYLNLPDKQIF